MDNLKNNLFYYATKELSQDAFICWLCSHSLEGFRYLDEELTKCADDFLCLFMKNIAENVKSDELSLIDIERQVENIDVLLTVEYKGKEYKIIVEDKTHTSEHDDQLARYKNSLEKKDYNVVGVYFKTGFQSDLSIVKNAGYVVVNREDILNLLRQCGSNNDIFKAYFEYWNQFDELAKSFIKLPLNKWPDWQTVNGFYEYLKNYLETNDNGENWAGYGFVSNKSGGFWGFWYGTSDADNIDIDKYKAELYPQIETKWNNDTGSYDMKICLKLVNKMDSSDDSQLRKLRDIIVDKYGVYNFERPSRLSFGQHMTVGVYSANLSDCNFEELKEKVLESLDNYKKLSKAVLNELKKDIN